MFLTKREYIENLLLQASVREEKFLRYYFLEGRTKKEIAYLYDISQTRVTQIIDHGIKTIRRYIVVNGLKVQVRQILQTEGYIKDRVKNKII
jgi:DNA-directed RNA polymerase specialized sigma subunit